MNRGNIVRGLVVAAFGVLAIAESLRLRPLRGPKPVGDDTFPFIIGGALFALGAVLFFWKNPADPKVSWPERGQLSTMVLTLLSLSIYTGILSIFGYILSTFALAIVLFRLIGKYRWYSCLIMGGVTAVFLWQVFVVWLHMPFPSGIWVE